MVQPTLSTILALYAAVCPGFDPATDANDNGAIVEDVLTYWRKTGLLLPDGTRSKILGFARVNPRSRDEVLTAFQIGGIFDLGFTVTQRDEDQFAAGQTWDVVGDQGEILGGHSVVLGSYSGVDPSAHSIAKSGLRQDSAHARVLDVTDAGVLLGIGTWGAQQLATWAWWDEQIVGQGPRVDEAWWIATPQFFGRAGKNPAGLDLTTFGSDIAQITGDPNPFPLPRPRRQFRPRRGAFWGC